jgi:hypothetical protein
MMRCLFVSLVVGNVLLSFYDIPGGYFDEKDDDLTPAEEALLNGAFMNLVQNQSQRQNGPQQLVCTKCKKPKSDSGQGAFRCSKCHAVQREVGYCSR